MALCSVDSVWPDAAACAPPLFALQYRQCPPGLGGAGCELATCNSTFVEPSARTSKGPSDQACTTCDAGFTGLNCNLCDGLDSCDGRQRAVGRGASGVASSGLVSINNTLTCHNQPHAITQNNVQCDVDQATLAALFPGRITLTAIKVARVPNWDTTGLAQWDASGNSSYTQVFLDGVEQVSVACEAPGDITLTPCPCCPPSSTASQRAA